MCFLSWSWWTTGQLPMSENNLTLEFTKSRLVQVLYHSWALPTSGEWTSNDLGKYIHTRFQDLQSIFVVFTTLRQKSSEKAPCVRKPLTPFWDWLKTYCMTSKSFTKWEVCTFRIGASRCGASYDRFRERNVTFFSLSTSGVWKQVDSWIHR